MESLGIYADIRWPGDRGLGEKGIDGMPLFHEYNIWLSQGKAEND